MQIVKIALVIIASIACGLILVLGIRG